MVIDNLHGPIKEAIVLGDFRTFPQLFERAARMQRMDEVQVLNSLNGGLRTQQPTQEARSASLRIRFKHSRMHRDNRAPGITIQGAGPQPTPLRPSLPNRNRKTQRKLRPDPLLTTQRLRPNMILSSNNQAPLAIELTTPHYPLSIPTLPYSPSFWFQTWKAISLPRDQPLPWPPGLDYFQICPFHRYHTIEECPTLRDGIYDMNDENCFNWNEVKAYLNESRQCY